MTMDRPSVLLAALIAEALFGYPARLTHPVALVGQLIAHLDQHWNAGSYRRFMGVLVALILIALGSGAGFAIESIASGWSGAIAVIVIATTGLAQRSLHDHVVAVSRPLLAGDLRAARTAVSMIVGRDTAALDAPGVAAAATETLAESFCDGVVAPAFWFLIFGLPGLFAFKCISTADSMIGHMDDRYRDFGWASARADDVLNWVPARIAAVLICIASGREWFKGWRVMRRDAGKHLSPNSGWPESAMAGALGVQLGGGAAYDGEWITRAKLGNGERPVAADLLRALTIYRRACLVLWVIIGIIAGALIWLR
jgi:adenosylcobinamide-phosphate synthase